ncbi:MAG: hypothetical protein OXI55_17220 [Gammaproteobacteria bacterium]|nr:hypothetical protein [Gammaproteobacteria bacterium]
MARQSCAVCALVMLLASSAFGAKDGSGEPVSHIVVGGTDTLWSIAAQVRRDDVSIEETMFAIVRANPSAFTDGDPSQLRAGARLALPWVDAPVEAERDRPAPPVPAAVAPPTRAPTEDAAAMPLPDAGAAATIERLTAEIDELRAEVARGVEAHARVTSERDRLLEENTSLRAQERSDVAEPSRPQLAQAAAGRPARAPVLLPAVALLLGLLLGVGGSAGWRRWQRRPVPAVPSEPLTSPMDRLASRVRTVAAPAAVASSPTTPATSTPDDLDAAIETVEGDPVAVKLELARAYIDIGDVDSANEVLKEISAQGNPEQRAAAAELLQRL